MTNPWPSLARWQWLGGVLVALVMHSAPTVRAQSPATIDAALRVALDTSPSLQARQADLTVLEESRVQVAAGGDFSLSANLTGQQDFSVQGGVRGSERDGAPQGSVGLRASRLLYDGERTTNAVARVDANLQSARHGLVAAEQGVLLDAAQAYLELLRAGELLVLASGNARLLREELAAAQDRLRVGSGSRTDVAQAEARLAAAESNVAASRARQAIARAEFERAVGASPGAELAAPVDLPTVPVSLGATLTQAQAEHPDIAAARAAEAAAMSGLAEAQSERGPTVSLFGRATHALDGAARSGSRDSTDVTVGVELSHSLYSGGAVESRIRGAMATIRSQQATRASVERRVRQGAVAAWEGLVAARATIESNETRVAAAELAFQGVRERLAVGLGTTLDVLDAEQEALDARVALVQAKYDVFIAAFQVRAAIGTLTAEELGL